MHEHHIEVESGERFEFGKNWANFLQRVDNDRAQLVTKSLTGMLGVTTLDGTTFLDIGSGSGLFSLAARLLGARVHSFDFDPQSVGCTRELRRRFFPDDSGWTVQQGSILDKNFLRTLGQFDIVYSWGVLHHTGAMWEALENAAAMVKPGGRIFVSIYNDQGPWSRRWLAIKKVYNWLPRPLRGLYTALVLGPREIRYAAADTLKMRPLNYIRRWTEFHELGSRGMSRWHDMVDWVGGYPFEVAKPEQIFEFFTSRGFRMTKLTTCLGGFGCNEYIFVRER